MYREHCQFDTKEESPLEGIDVGENFFTPTMTKYRQERSKEVKTLHHVLLDFWKLTTVIYI